MHEEYTEHVNKIVFEEVYMRRKLVLGLTLFIVGILLQVVSDIMDIWIIGVIGGVLWPVGMVIGVNASIAHDKKRNKSPSQQLSEKEDC